MEAEKELKLEGLDKKFDQLKTKIKDMSDNQEKDFESLTERLSNLE